MSEDAFHVFVSALGGMDLFLTTRNMDDLRLLCEEFGFTNLVTCVMDFILAHPVVEDETRKGVSDIVAENFQIKGSLFPLQEARSGLGTVNLHLAGKMNVTGTCGRTDSESRKGKKPKMRRSEIDARRADEKQQEMEQSSRFYSQWHIWRGSLAVPAVLRCVAAPNNEFSTRVSQLSRIGLNLRSGKMIDHPSRDRSVLLPS